MVKVGLVTLAVTPRARHAPRTKVVLPAPSSPLTSTTSPGPSPAASRAPAASVSSGELLKEAQLLDVTGLRLCVRLVLGLLGHQRGQLREVLAQELLDRTGPQRGRRVEQRQQLENAARDFALLRPPVDL